MSRFFSILLLFCAVARGSQDQAYGLGGLSTGRAGAVTADTVNPFAALSNPGLLSAAGRSRFSFTTSAVAVSYSPLKGVRTTSGGRAGGDFQPPDTRVALWSLGYTYPLELPDWAEGRRGGLGLALSGPFDRLRTFSAGAPEDFFSLRYGAADTQFKGTVGAAAELIPGWLSFGAGLSLFITSSGAAEVSLASANPTGRLAVDVGLRLAPLLGLFAGNGTTGLSLVYREPIDPAFQQAIEGNVDLGGETVLKQPVLVRSSLYYEPRLLETDLQHDFGPLVVSVGAAFQQWSRYRPAFLLAETPDASGRVHRTVVPALHLRDTLSPRVSVEVPLLRRRLTFAGGYSYRPSPVADLSGPANPLDTDVHAVGVSLGHALTGALSWGLFAQYHWMKPRRVAKARASSVGAPGYELQGRAYTYGVSIGADW